MGKKSVLVCLPLVTGQRQRPKANPAGACPGPPPEDPHGRLAPGDWPATKPQRTPSSQSPNPPRLVRGPGIGLAALDLDSRPELLHHGRLAPGHWPATAPQRTRSSQSPNLPRLVRGPGIGLAALDLDTLPDLIHHGRLAPGHWPAVEPQGEQGRSLTRPLRAFLLYTLTGA